MFATGLRLSMFKISYRICYVSDNELRKIATLFQVGYVSFIYSSVGFWLEDSV